MAVVRTRRRPNSPGINNFKTLGLGLGLVGGARVTARPGVRVGVGVGAICYVTLNVIVVCDMVSFPTWSVVSF